MPASIAALLLTKPRQRRTKPSEHKEKSANYLEPKQRRQEPNLKGLQRTHHGKAGNLEIRVALGTMTRGAKDKEDEMIQKSGAGEDEQGAGEENEKGRAGT